MLSLSNNDLKMFENIASMKQATLLKTMDTILRKKYKKVCMTRDYIYAEGDIPVALISHLDTVFKHPPKNIYYDKAKGTIWSPEGLGADDRAGIFAIIKIIESGLKPHIIFTTDEEIGGIGAENLTKVVPKSPFKELKYIIELDRQGTNDCVFYNCDNKDFINYVERFGFIEDIGSFSDISIICPAWKVAGVNLSIGYKNEHSVSETLHVAPMLKTIQKVKNMLLDAENINQFKWIEGSWFKKYSQLYGYSFFPIEEDEPFVDYGYGTQVVCNHCNKLLDEYETFPVKGLDGTLKHYCSDCIVDNVEWCEECQEAFEIDPSFPTERLCNDCKVMLKNKGKVSNGIRY